VKSPDEDEPLDRSGGAAGENLRQSAGQRRSKPIKPSEICAERFSPSSTASIISSSPPVAPQRSGPDRLAEGWTMCWWRRRKNPMPATRTSMWPSPTRSNHAIPRPGGHTVATYSGNDERGSFAPARRVQSRTRSRNGTRLDDRLRWLRKGDRFPFGLMLRPDNRVHLRAWHGFGRGVRSTRSPDTRCRAWIRDTFIMLGHDGIYYLTGTSGNMDALTCGARRT